MFRYCLLTALIFFLSIRPLHAWMSYEHSEMGDLAFELAIADIDEKSAKGWQKLLLQPHIHNDYETVGAVVDGVELTSFSFGQLVGIYGDYAHGFEDLNNSTIAGRQAHLKKIVSGTRSTEFPEEHKHMKGLAVNNASHFSLRAAQTYVKWHRKALLLASSDAGRLWEALHYEALALHSLTDLFAFGHMLEDRQLTDRIFTWAKSARASDRISRESRISMATAAGKAMGGYVNFYHNAYNWRGAMMMNLAGDSWRGFGDGRYRIVDRRCTAKTHLKRRTCVDIRTERQRAIIVQATKVSILSVLNTALGRNSEIGSEYAAICYIPVHFWDTNAPIEPESQLRAIWRLSSAMKAKGRSLENNGFDFSLGHLKFEKKELRGTVEYIDYVKLHCRTD